MKEDRTEDLKPWGDDVALMGPNAPKWDGHIEHLIGYLLTVHKRFGNTTVTADLQWGATAMHKQDRQKERIAELEKIVPDVPAALVDALTALLDGEDTFDSAVNAGPERDELNKQWKEYKSMNAWKPR